MQKNPYYWRVQLSKIYNFFMMNFNVPSITMKTNNVKYKRINHICRIMSRIKYSRPWQCLVLEWTIDCKLYKHRKDKFSNIKRI